MSSTRLAPGTTWRACDEEVGPRQPRHPLVGDEQRHLVAARDEVAQDVERLLPRARAQDPVALAEAPAQVARDRREHGRLVVDREDRGTSPTLAVVGASHSRERYWSAIAASTRGRLRTLGTARKASAHAMPTALIPSSVSCVPTAAASGPATAVPTGMRIVLAM